MRKFEWIYNRRSVRKFTDEKVSNEDLQLILESAIEAPSAKNIQNWHFVVLKNKDMIDELANIILLKNKKLSEFVEEEKKEKFIKFSKYATIFKGAPIVILAYMGKYKLEDLDSLTKLGDKETIEKIISAAPGVHGVSAAMQNLMLVASELGYGTCWMTSQNYAISEIEKFIGLEKEGYQLMAMTPLGRPAQVGKRPLRKSLSEVVTIIE